MNKRPLYIFKLGDTVIDDGVIMTVSKFNREEVTLVDSDGVEYFAHPLYLILPYETSRQQPGPD